MRRRISKICFLLSVMLILLFLVSCADLADFGGEEGEQFDAYYKYFGDIVAIYYENGSEASDTFEMKDIYNASTQDKGTTPVDFKKYKFIYVTLTKDIYLDGIGIFFKTKTEEPECSIMVECYYASGWNLAKDDDYTCDMFRGTYEYIEDNMTIRLHLDGHGKCNTYVKSINPANGEEQVVEYEDQTYTTTITDNLKMFKIRLPNTDEFEIRFNPLTKNVFDGYLNGVYRRVKKFKYTSDFDIGTVMFDGTRSFIGNEWNSFYADEYTMEITDTTVNPPKVYSLDGQKKVHLEAGNGLLFKIMNNCFDGPKYDLHNVEFVFNNIVMRNKKG